MIPMELELELRLRLRLSFKRSEAKRSDADIPFKDRRANASYLNQQTHIEHEVS